MRTLVPIVAVGALAVCFAVAAAPKETSMSDQAKNEEKAEASIDILDPEFRALLRPDSKLEVVARDFKFTEGPAWMPGGFYVFSDIPPGILYRWAPGGKVEEFRQDSQHANGNDVDPEGRLVTCHHGSRSMTRTEKDGTVVTLCSTYQGKRLNSPNDVACRSDGTIWFTDPPYGIKEDQREQPKNYVFRLDPGAKEPVVVADDFGRPNGLCFSPDEKWLYIGDSDHERSLVRRFRVTDDLALVDGMVFVEDSPPAPDGIRCDAAGRLWTASGDGVHVFSTKGKLIGRLRLKERPTNLEFGGPEGDLLLVTDRPLVYTIRLNVKGGAWAKKR